MAAKGRPQYLGLLMLFVKLGPKIFPLISKVLKGLFSLKAAGAAASLGLYSYLLTWEMGVSLVIFILVHEYGHLWAMQQCGLKTKGIFLIPGFGGVAMAAEKFRSGRNEAYIAIMGPVFGLFLAIPLFALYVLTGNQLYMAITSFVVFINLLNLLPINPLDGGRIVKAITYSVKESWGFFAMFVSFLVSAVLAFHFDFGLLGFIALVGLYEVMSDYGVLDSMGKFMRTLLRIFGAWMLYLLISILIEKGSLVGNGGAFGLLLFSLTVLAACGILVASGFDAYKRTNGKIITYPVDIIADFFAGIKEFFSLKHKNLRRIDGHEQMDKKQLLQYSLYYILIFLAHIPVIVYAAKISNFGLAAEMLK
ncbi:MAG: hypothetical protein HY363_03800 [Candidatus Aenigmarchaeota archaeon]|nr:hypothetical protein [Parcubacteria group bacterium]MBI4016791.1 hypothetical protein [Candidatus Aenigmarchaeota archaeon]